MKRIDLYLKAISINSKSTVSYLFVNDVFVCHTLEDVYRGLPDGCPNTPSGMSCVCKEKVYGKTCIPAGRYRCSFPVSPKYGKRMPKLNDVPHFLGILIHSGNTVDDTDGCILVGDYNPSYPNVLTAGSSKPKFEIIYSLFDSAFETYGSNLNIAITVDRKPDGNLPFVANMDTIRRINEINTAIKNKNYAK